MTLPGIKVLLIQNDSRDADRLGKMLAQEKSLPFKLESVNRLQDGLNCIKKKGADLILLDLKLPDANGKDPFTQLTSSAPNVPVIVLSEGDDDKAAVDAVKRGAQDYVVKGRMDTQLLVRVMRYAIERKRVADELQFRVDLEKLIATISTDFIDLPISKFDGAMVEGLAKIAQYLRAKRGYIFKFSDPEAKLERIHEWHDSGLETMMQRFQGRHFDEFAWLSPKLRAGEIVQCRDIAELPPEAKAEKTELQAQKLKSFVCLPMMVSSQFKGFVFFGSEQDDKSWNQDLIQLLKLVAEIFASAVHRKRAEEALLESEERYALAVRGANEGLWDWNLKNGTIYFSPRWKNMVGASEEEEMDSPNEWFDRIHPDDIEQVKSDLNVHLEGLTPYFESEHRLRHSNGSYRWVLNRGIAVRGDDGVAYRMAGSFTDVTDRRVAQEQLLHNAFHDSLTGLPSRALFIDRLGRSINRSKRNENIFYAVLFLDLDRFKILNDSLGHMIGDQLLVGIARRLEVCLHPGDTVARVGGDEFTILLEDLKDARHAAIVAEKIKQKLAMPFNLNGHEVYTSGSIGIALSTANYEKPEDVLRDADNAMYRAKARGRNCHEVFDKNMHVRAVAQLELETDLRRAIERNEFCAFYQPIISLDSGKIDAFEALVRWRHPKRGLVSPVEFIPVAEETGLIVPMGWWMLREACRQMKEWQDKFPTEPPLSISVNLSAKQVMQPDLVDQIQSILLETNFDARNLVLEITESVLMDSQEMATSMLRRLHNLNIQLHMDDFGTGYSSLSYLHRFQIDALKIDRSFVGRLGEAEGNVEIVKTVVTLSKNLGIGCIAEGVETAEQLALLRKLKCRHGQGYFFSKPLAAKEIAKLIERSPTW